MSQLKNFLAGKISAKGWLNVRLDGNLMGEICQNYLLQPEQTMTLRITKEGTVLGTLEHIPTATLEERVALLEKALKVGCVG